MAEPIVPFPDAADVEPLVHHDDAAPPAAELTVDVLVKGLDGVVRFGHVELEGHPALGVAQPGGGGDEAGFPSHGLQHGHGLRDAHAAVLFLDVLDQGGPVAGRAAVARRVIDDRELGVPDVVVDGLGHAGHDQLDPALPREAGHFGGGVHGVVSTNIEEVADVVRPDHIHDALEVLRLPVGQLVPARADDPRRGSCAEQLDLGRGLTADVEELFQKDAFDAVPCSVQSPEMVGMLAARFDDPLEGGVDDGRRPAGLRDKGVWFHARILPEAPARAQRSHSTGRTFCPSLRNVCPSITTIVPSDRPEVISVTASVAMPVCTDFFSTTPSATVYT